MEETKTQPIFRVKIKNKEKWEPQNDASSGRDPMRGPGTKGIQGNDEVQKPKS